MFSDARFMTAKEKRLLANAWEVFVKGTTGRVPQPGFQWTHFSKRIYNYLSLHVGHIAHFDRGGFYSAWLDRGEDRVAFIDHFLSYRVADEYADVHAVMVEVLREHEDRLREEARADEVARLTATRAEIDERIARLTKGSAA